MHSGKIFVVGFLQRPMRWHSGVVSACGAIIPGLTLSALLFFLHSVYHKLQFYCLLSNVQQWLDFIDAFSTFVCPTEITAFSDRAAEFRKLNAELIACSCDSQFSHLAWTQTPRNEGGLGDMQVSINDKAVFIT